MGALNPARANQQTRDVLAEEDAMHPAMETREGEKGIVGH
jgi:hypothetical protein